MNAIDKLKNGISKSLMELFNFSPEGDEQWDEETILIEDEEGNIYYELRN